MTQILRGCFPNFSETLNAATAKDVRHDANQTYTPNFTTKTDFALGSAELFG
jgi:hypothetical protein